MGTSTNIAGLQRDIEKKIEVALTKTASDLVERATELIWEKFYKEYTPKEGGYERTYQLLNSIMKTKVTKQANTYSVAIYLDPTGVIYKSDPAIDVFLLASEGYHGTKSIETDFKFWVMFVNEFFGEWREYLRKHGLNVV